MAYFASFIVLFVIFVAVCVLFVGSAIWVYFFDAPKLVVDWFANNNIILMVIIWILMVTIGWLDDKVAALSLAHMI